MFFKKAIQTLTDVKLQDSLRGELAHIEKKHDTVFIRLAYHQYELWRTLTISAYRAVAEVKKTQEVAKSLNTEQAWLQAYRDAEKADAAVAKLLTYKLDFFLYPCISNSTTVILMLAVSAHSFLRGNKAIHDPIDVLFLAFVFILLLPEVCRSNLRCMRESLKAILIEPYWCKLILLEAEASGIAIDINQDVLSQASSQPWANAALLEDIGCDDVPDEFLCSIALDVMTKPVYCMQHSDRYDLKAINQWLCVRNMHPKAHEVLYWDDLIPDNALEEKINRFTHDKTKAYIHQTSIKMLLECVEKQAEDERSEMSSIAEF